ncbi:tetratricopeptide repeat protein [Roseomonas marmotae]|uniref:Tetratricopeptide repeat protein n=1 Tax=Roseomonas marmotae TaxID=2768161 RepID=A0ABS3K925_9PROT|nr:tetratricopeptide repeat protein [Roseomonas marmotae]MBO1073517.1 tetratricopeptide repeat protein [Roseomonas marmotae]QTI80294.1 tetratricopeptide repeat protein [Roseomonas marmotae]
MVALILPRRVALLSLALMAGIATSGLSGRAPASATDIRPRLTASGAYLAGSLAARETDTAAAADLLLEALRLAPNQPEVIRRAFLAAILDGRPEAVRVARRMPENELAAMVLAGADGMAGRWERAEARLRAMPRQAAGQILQPVLLAWTQAGRGQTDAALATLKPQIESSRLSGLAALHGAMIADLGKRPKEAERLIRTALANSPEVNLRLVQIAAGILGRAGKETEAMKLVESISTGGDDLAMLGTPEVRRRILQERAVTSAVEGMAEAQLALAAALRGQGGPELSMLLARLSLRLRPDFVPAMLVASEALAEEQHPERALALLQRVSQDDPLLPVVMMRRATLLDRLDRPDEAIATLRVLAEARPEAPQPFARLGDLMRSRKRYAEAVEAYDTAIARVGEAGPNSWSLLYARGISLERSDQWPRAEADFKAALKLAPEQPYILNYLGYTWVERGENLAEAREMLERAMALRPQDGNIADSLGWALFKLGDMPNATKWLERAVELESRNATINDHLGDVYWATGREAEAVYQWRRALISDPEPDETPRIEAKLRERQPSSAAR